MSTNVRKSWKTGWARSQRAGIGGHLGLLLLCVILLAPGQALAQQNLLFILDASGSMWGRVDDTPKIVLAREAMTELVSTLPADARPGLMAYGHRRKGDCGDIESLVTLKDPGRDAVISHIQALSPKGKTPITGAIEQAVAQMRPLESATSIVLLSDGLESCGGDPCDAVRAARQAGIDFRLHVVGFDLGDTDPAQLQCMAEAGGGEFFTAANADELSGALEQAVVAMPALVLEVVSNGEATPARVTVYSTGGDKLETVRIGESATGNRANPQRIELAPGDYDIHVVATAIQGERTRKLSGLTIPDAGDIVRTVDFTDGELSVEVTANGSLGAAKVDIFPAGSDNKLTYRRIDGDAGENPAAFRLPPGQYDIRVVPRGIEAGAKWLRGVAVGAGERSGETVDFSFGQLSAGVTVNGAKAAARVDIFPAGSDDKLTYRRIDASENSATFQVPPGEYDLKIVPARLEVAPRWLRGVAVSGGQTTAKSADFAMGELTVGVTTAGQLSAAKVDIYTAADEYLTYRRIDADADENPTTFRLPPGDYDIKVQSRGSDAPDQWLRDVTVVRDQVARETVVF